MSVKSQFIHLFIAVIYKIAKNHLNLEAIFNLPRSISLPWLFVSQNPIGDVGDDWLFGAAKTLQPSCTIKAEIQVEAPYVPHLLLVLFVPKKAASSRCFLVALMCLMSLDHPDKIHKSSVTFAPRQCTAVRYISEKSDNAALVSTSLLYGCNRF